MFNPIRYGILLRVFPVWFPTAGCPCCRMSIWAKEHVSPTPTTSTVKFLKKSIISRDFLLRLKIRMIGVTTGLSSSSRIKTFKDPVEDWKEENELASWLKEIVLLFCITVNSNNKTVGNHIDCPQCGLFLRFMNKCLRF